jgi:hypothetical protein
MKHSLLIALALTTGCVSEVTSSSASYLAPEQSGALSAKPILETAREVTRLMEVRGYAMLDQHQDGSELVIKYSKDNRALAATKDDDQLLNNRDVGSVFYVWVTPAASGSAVKMIGKPTLNGAEPCSDDGIQPCQHISVADQFRTTFMSGRLEADVVHGVLSQLQLEGIATGPLPAPPKAAVTVDNSCEGKRRAVFTQANSISDPAARAKFLESAPSCGG